MNLQSLDMKTVYEDPRTFDEIRDLINDIHQDGFVNVGDWLQSLHLSAVLFLAGQAEDAVKSMQIPNETPEQDIPIFNLFILAAIFATNEGISGNIDESLFVNLTSTMCSFIFLEKMARAGLVRAIHKNMSFIDSDLPIAEKL